MATVSKTVSGATTTYTVVDSGNNSMTLTVVQGPAGQTVAFAGAPQRLDGVQMVFNLLNQLQSGILPGAGAQAIQP